MPTKLKNLVITKVALVDEGSCSAANIKLYKRREGGNQVMDQEELLKLIPEDQREAAKTCIEKAKSDAAAAAKTKAEAATEDALDGGMDDAMENPDGTPKNDTKKKTVAKVAAKISALNGEIAKLKGETAGKSDEELLKSVDPAIRALIEKSRNQAVAAETAIKKMKEDLDDREALSKAKELPNIGASEDELAKSFKALKNADVKLFDNVFGIMKAADALIAAGDPLGEVGTGTQDDVQLAKAADAAWSEIEKKAGLIQKDGKCSKEQAIAKAIKENDGLYKRYLDSLK